MKLTGWAFDATEEQKIKSVEVYYNGILRGACELNYYRRDVAAYLVHSDKPEAIRSGQRKRIQFIRRDLQQFDAEFGSDRECYTVHRAPAGGRIQDRGFLDLRLGCSLQSVVAGFLLSQTPFQNQLGAEPCKNKFERT